MLYCHVNGDGLPMSNVNPCGACSLSAKAKLILYVQCGKWFHGSCTGVKKVTPKF